MFSRFITWNTRSLARWEAARALGRSRFVWRYGVLMFGSFMFVANLAMNLIFEAALIPEDGPGPVVTISINLVVWTLAGYAWGAWMWWLMDRSYSEWQSNNERIST